MSPLEQLQSDVTARLLSESTLVSIPCKSLRKMRLQSELDLALLYATPRDTGTKIGAGIMVGMPTLDVEHPNTPGPALTLTLPIRIYEDPLTNLNPNLGTLLTAEEISTLVIQLLHQLRIEGLCGLYAGKDSMHPSDAPDGVIAYEVLLRAELAQDIILRVTLPEISETDLTVTLTPVEPGTMIWYTLDTTYPGSGNTAAIIYSAPFLVPAGTVVRWAGYKQNWQASDVGQATISRGVLATEFDLSKITLPEGGGIIVQ